MERTGPLCGVRIVEFAGVGPGPFCAMLLADMGADIVSVDRVVPHGLGIRKETRFNTLARSRPSVALDLKSETGREAALRLVVQADALIEGFRPGVMERLGLGPDVCLARNPRLVYGRVTGWGQEGPLADQVGHDLNYLAITGLLAMLGPREGKPSIPLNLLGDFAGGGLYLALGVLAAILEARASGQGQTVEAAMLDGMFSLLTHHFGFVGSGQWIADRESNYLDGGAPWYNVYPTRDGKHVSVAAIEPKYYRELLRRLSIDPDSCPDPYDRASWPAMRERLAAVFATRTREEWCAVMDRHEVCFAPVLDLAEAAVHPHVQARGTFVEIDGVKQPRPTPRFGRTQGCVQRGPAAPGADTAQALRQWGFSDEEIEGLQLAKST